MWTAGTVGRPSPQSAHLDSHPLHRRAMSEIILMNDPRVADIPVRECDEPLVDLRELPYLRVDTRLADPVGAYALLREGAAARLDRAARLLPLGLRLLATEGYRPLGLQQRYFDRYEAELR